MLKPLIGVATNSCWINTYGALSRSVTAMTNSNIEPIVDNGGIPVLMTQLTNGNDISEFVSKLDGVFFPGGQDVHPDFYNEKQKVTYSDDVNSTGIPYLRPKMMMPNKERDAFELKVFKEAKKQNKPIFGICRGMQIINVALGGNLYQEVSEASELQHDVDHSGYIHHHIINITEGSFFEECFQSRQCIGPSCHHQSINKLGDGLLISGRASDGVIEFIEYHNNDSFIIGAQGDIERSRVNFDGYNTLYSKFISACVSNIQQ